MEVPSPRTNEVTAQVRGTGLYVLLIDKFNVANNYAKFCCNNIVTNNIVTNN